ncbi:MAG: type II toxin-antitoxin system PemK/MazF family toxin [Nanoarchaeota archaeon]
MKKGEIWLVNLPSANGREQSGLRPALLLSEVETNIIMIVPFTSNIQALRFPSTIEVKPSKENGLNSISTALIFQLRAIDKNRLNKKIGHLEKDTLKEVDLMVKKLLKL